MVRGTPSSVPKRANPTRVKCWVPDATDDGDLVAHVEARLPRGGEVDDDAARARRGPLGEGELVEAGVVDPRRPERGRPLALDRPAGRIDQLGDAEAGAGGGGHAGDVGDGGGDIRRDLPP